MVIQLLTCCLNMSTVAFSCWGFIPDNLLWRQQQLVFKPCNVQLFLVFKPCNVQLSFIVVCFVFFEFFGLLISIRQKSDVLSKGDVEDVDDELKKLDLLYVSMTTNFFWYAFLLLHWCYALKQISVVNLAATKMNFLYQNLLCI